MNPGATRPRPAAATVLAVLAALGLALLFSAGAAHAATTRGAWWLVDSGAAPTNLKPGTKVVLYSRATNIGYEDVNGVPASKIVVTQNIPAGLKILEEGAEGGIQKGLSPRPFHPLEPVCKLTGQVYRCEIEGLIRPAESIRIRIEAEVEPSVALGSTLTNEFSVEGGTSPAGEGPEAKSFKKEMPVTNEPVPFGTDRFEMRPENKGGTIDTQAGSHPFQFTTVFDLKKTLELGAPLGNVAELPFLAAQPRDLHFTLPPGFAGAVAKTPRCSGTDFLALINSKSNACKPNMAIGYANAFLDEPSIIGPFSTEVPIYNLTPNVGEPARFGFIAKTVPVVLTTHVRSGSDYAVEVSVHLLPESIEILNTEATFWGVPGAPEHNNQRSWRCLGGGYLAEEGEAAAEGDGECDKFEDPNPQALLTTPTSCEGTPASTVDALAWTGEKFTSSAPFAPFTGCEALPFSPSIEVEPDEHSAATPTGLTVNVKLPQQGTLDGKEGALAESAVKKTTLTLPAGIQTSGGAADGLLTCTSGQFGFNGPLGNEEETVESLAENDHFNQADIECPDAAKIGTVNIKTPLIEEELTGSVYLASANTNPFKSPLVLYVFAEGPESKVKVKLAGKVKIDPNTGQLTSVFDHTPPLAFSELHLHLFNGPRASQSTPEQCGEYSAAAEFIGSANEPEKTNAIANVTSPAFKITSGANGTACPAPGTQPFAPTAEAGTESAKAGEFSPFVVNVGRPDGSQALKSLTIHEPPGAAAMLASVTPCPIALATAPEPNCPASSKIGESIAYAGLGSDHVKIAGQVYLTGPYKNGPFGVLDVSNAEHIGVPACASETPPAGQCPFNLGKISVMSTITVNETTGAATIVSDTLPERVRGVPSQIHSLHIVVNRPGFTFNPTNCNPLAVTGTLTGFGPNGADGTAGFETPFHGEGCAALPFKPTIEVSIESNVSRYEGTGLKIVVKSSHGQANIGKSKIEFPNVVPSRVTTLKKACPDYTFEANPANCSPESIVGTGTAHTPVLKVPLTGPIYLVSHASRAFPDAVFVLQGEGIKLVLDGATDIEPKNGKQVTISSFESVPDAPVESFEVSLPRGPKSAFSGYGNLCTENPVMPTTFTGQNGKILKSTIKVAVTGCAAVKKFKAAKASELQKNLKVCAKLAKGKRAKCVASAHKRSSAVQACKKLAAGKRSGCEAKARKKNPLKS